MTSAARWGMCPALLSGSPTASKNYGPDNVYVVGFVQSVRLRDLFAEFLFVQDGPLQTARVPGASLVWTNSRSDKRWSFVDKGLTHFIDDQVEALVSIRAACWERRERARPPALFLVPTAWANGRRSDFGRTCSDAARASKGWEEEWHIYPQITVGRVCPWDPDWAAGDAAAGS